MMIPPKIRALLGFAQKSRQLFSGETAVANCLKTRKAQLVLIATDFPEKRKQYFINWCLEENITYILWSTKQIYGEILGTSPRSLVAITNKQIAQELRRLLSAENGDEH